MAARYYRESKHRNCRVFTHECQSFTPSLAIFPPLRCDFPHIMLLFYRFAESRRSNGGITRSHNNEVPIVHTQSRPNPESGAQTPVRNSRGASPARNCSPGFVPADPGDHIAVLVHPRAPHLVTVVPRTVAEYRMMEQDERRLSREQTAREQACPSGTPTGTMRHKRRKRGGKGRRHHQPG